MQRPFTFTLEMLCLEGQYLMNKFKFLFNIRLGIINKILIFFFINSYAFAFHDVDVADEEIAVLGGLWTQIFVFEEYCSDSEYYQIILDRVPTSPRFERYSLELEHLTNDQELAFQRGGAGATAGIVDGATDCETMATVIWEWFGEN